MSSRRRLLWLAVALVLVGGLAWGTWKAVRVLTLARDVQTSISNIERLLTGDSGFPALAKLRSLEEELKKGHQQLQSLRGEMGPLWSIRPALRILPGIGQDIDKSPRLLEAADVAAEAGVLAMEGLDPFLHMLEEGGLVLTGPSSQAQAMVDALGQGRPLLLQAQERLEGARRLLATAKEGRLSSRLDRYAVRLDRLLGKLGEAVELELAAPDLARTLLGVDGKATLLIVAQNTYELRATGGFISAVWLMEMENGQVASLDFYNSADVDDLTQRYPPPPLAINKYMLASIWVFRDANWSPDFPTSARVAENLFFMGQKVRGDGMMAIDELALRDILDVLGPVELEAFGETVDASNILPKLEQGLDPGFEPGPGSVPPRKFFLKVLFEELQERVEAGLTQEEASRLVSALFRNLNEKHLLIYSHEPELAQFLAQRSWDGALRPYTGDTLMVVDSNVGYNKVNPKIQQSLEYTVDIQDDGSATGELLVNYLNTSSGPPDPCIQQATRGGYPEWKEGCYWDYLRVLVPRGSSLLPGTSYFPLPEGSLLRWLGKREDANLPVAEPFIAEREAFSNFFAVAPGESLPVRFRYSLPGGVLRQQGEEYVYSLLLQKQPGTQAIPITVRIAYPDYLALAEWSGAERVENAQGLLEIETELREDVTIAVKLTTKK